MGITAIAVALTVSTLVAGCLLWTLMLHFEELYPVAKDRARQAGLLFRTFTVLTAVGILAVLLLEFQELVTS